MKRILCSSLMVYGLLAPAVRAAEEPFAALSFDQALKRALAEKKLVFVDFYAAWCVPCKIMDATTFKDPKVVQFLKDKVVALRVDVEQQAALAEKYHVSGFPTLMFLQPEGKVVEVIAGATDAEDFLHRAENALAGRDTLTQYRQALKSAPNDPTLHARIAEALTVRGETAEALEHCKQVLQRKDLDTFAAEMVPAVVSQLLALAEVSPEAQRLLNPYYAAAADAVVQGRADNVQIAAFGAVHMLKGDLGDVLSAYDRLLAGGAPAEYLQRVTVLWRVPLLAAERYADIARRVNIPEEAARSLAKLPAGKPSRPAAAQGDYDPLAAMRRQVLGGVLDYYKVLVAVDRQADADALALNVLKVDDSAGVYDALAWSAYETGKVSAANLVQARKAHELSGGKDASIVDTLARVLYLSGRKDEAMKLVHESLAWAQPGFERALLEQCLADFADGNAPSPPS